MKQRRSGRSSASVPASSASAQTVPWPTIPLWMWVPALVATAFGMLGWCWAHSADVIVDFGREAYVPWRLTAGSQLYTDIAYFNGPFSPYWNTLWFWVFGPSIRCLALVNMAVVLIALWLCYQILTPIARQSTVVLCLFVFVLVFACGHHSGIGNYNFIYPYSHEMTHGTVLSLAAIWCFASYLKRTDWYWAVGSGVFAGLTFLTKPEIFLALAGGLGAGLVSVSVVCAQRQTVWRLWACFLAGAVVPPLVSLGLLSLSMSPRQALAGMITGFVGLTNRELTMHPFYRKVMGNWSTGMNLLGIVFWSVVYLVVFGPVALWARRSQRAWLAALVVAAVTGSLAYYFTWATWRDGLYPLPLFLSIAALWTAVDVWRRRTESALPSQELLSLVWIVFALLMMLKVVLRVKALHYGFALALPATLTFVAIMFDRIPRAIDRRGGAGYVFQAAFLAGLAVYVGAALNLDRINFGSKTIQVGTGADSLYGDGDRAIAVRDAIAEIKRLSRPDQTLVVLPEGVTINYLARRVNPTPFFNFMPAEIILFGEQRMVEAFDSHPPDYVIVVPNNLDEMGYKSFANDYALDIARWVSRHYDALPRVENGNPHQVLFMRRKGLAPTSSTTSPLETLDKPTARP